MSGKLYVIVTWSAKPPRSPRIVQFVSCTMAAPMPAIQPPLTVAVRVLPLGAVYASEPLIQLGCGLVSPARPSNTVVTGPPPTCQLMKRGASAIVVAHASAHRAAA